MRGQYCYRDPDGHAHPNADQYVDKHLHHHTDELTDPHPGTIQVARGTSTRVG
jgi:hypothetical protein